MSWRAPACAAASAFLVGAGITAASAQTALYWDVNGTTAGGAGAGTWSTAAANWNTDSTGVTAPIAWTQGNDALFSAGTDNTASTATLGENITARNITFEAGAQNENAVTIAGAGFTLTLTGNVTNNAATTSTAGGGGNQPSLSSNLVINSATTITTGNRFAIGASTGTALTGAGALTIVNQSTISRTDLRINASAFTGTVTINNPITTNRNVRMLANGGTFTGFNNAQVNLTGGGTNFDALSLSGGTTFNFGSLSGTNASVLQGSSLGGVATYSIGALNLSTTYGGTIVNGSTGGAALTKVGTGSLTLTGASSFTGAVNVSGGTLIANLANNAENVATSALGNPQVARNINVNNGGTLQFGAGDTLGGATSTIASTLVIAAGGTVTNNGASFNTLGAVNLNGGTLTGTGGSGNTQYQMYSLRGTVTVAGTAPSTISGTGTTSGYHLAAPTTFNVATTGTTGVADLTVSAPLIDQTGSQASAAGSLNKTGAGMMALAAANTYSGGTTINGGTLAVTVNGGLGTGNVTIAAAATLTLGTGVTAAHNAMTTSTLTLADTTSVVNLLAAAGTVQDTISTLTIGGQLQAAGTYGAAGSGAQFTLPEFTGTGVLAVAVPEPSTWTMMAAGLVGLGVTMTVRRRRNV